MKQIDTKNSKNSLIKYLSNQAFQILTLVVISFLLFISTFYWLVLPQIEESYYNSRKNLLKDMVSSAEGLVFDYYKRYESGELTEQEAKSRLKSRLSSMKYDNNSGYFWIINSQSVLVSHPYSLDILGKKIKDLDNTPEKEVLLKMHKLGQDSSEGFVYYKWTLPGLNKKIYSEKVAYIKRFDQWGYIIGTGAYLDDIKTNVASLKSDMSTAFFLIGLVILSLSAYIIRNTHKLNTKKDKAYKQLYETESKFRVFFDSTFQFMAVLDKNGYIKEINQSAYSFLKKGKEEFVDKLFWDTFFWENDFEAKLKLISGFQDVRKGRFVRFEATHTNHSGKVITVDFSLKPIYDSNGNFKQAIAEGRDISETKKVQNELKNSRERLSKVLEQSPMSTLIFDTNGNLMYSNEAWNQLWGNIAGRVEKFNVYEEHQHMKYGYNDAFDKARAGLTSMIGPFLFEKFSENSYESSKWLYSVVYPLSDNNVITDIVILYEDQTEQINISNALEQSEKWYKSLFNNAIDGILILERDIILEANPEFYRLFNTTSEQMKSKSILDYSPALQYKGEDSEEKALEIIDMILEGNSLHIPWLYKKEDGSTFDSEMSITRLDIPDRNLALVFVRDVSDRKRAYDAIQSIVEAVAAYTGQDFFNSIALNLNKILQSDYAMIAVKRNEDLYRSISLAKNQTIIKNVDFNIEGTPSKNIMENGLVVYHEDVSKIFPKDKILSDLKIEGYVGTHLVSSDNEVIGVLIALYTRPIQDDILSKEVLQIFGGRIAAEIERANFQDELIQLNKTLEKRIDERTHELQQINTELKDFAYIVSHDLKAPLRGISQLSDWIRSDIEDKLEDENIEMFDLLKSRIKKMYTLIDGVLDYSRVGRIEGQVEEIDLNELLKELFDLVKDDRESLLKIDSNLPVIKADKTRISQVYQNLFSNAFKYNNKDKVQITVSFEESVDFYRFSISDNGKGIEEKYFNKIFNIFQTIDAENEDSSGIGLSIVKKIVEHFGGTIEVLSEVGVGSSFIFSLNKQKIQF